MLSHTPDAHASASSDEYFTKAVFRLVRKQLRMRFATLVSQQALACILGLVVA